MSTNNYKPFSKFHEFESPIHVIWRKGTTDDPYIDRVDVTKVVNQRIVLLEVPDSNQRVKIPNMSEINFESFQKYSLDIDEFYVDYTNGFIYTHSSKEGQTLTCVYKGRGMLLYPTQRVIHWDGHGGYESMETIIERTKDQVQDLISHTDNFDEVMKKMVIAINDAQNATYYVKMAISDAEQATENAIKAYESTVMEWKPKVISRDELEVNYPLPKLGWTAYVTDENTAYRFDGIDWIPILSINEMVNKADDVSDGLMSKEDFIKLQNLSLQSSQKTVVFVGPPNEILLGVMPLHFVSPVKGEITSVEFSFMDIGSDISELTIEKSTDYVQWSSVTTKVEIPATSHYVKIENNEILQKKVNIGDKLRVMVNSSGLHKDMTININIQLDTV